MLVFLLGSGGQDVIDSSRITLEFSDSGRIHGNTGCNRYSGNCEITGAGIDISELSQTRIAAAPAMHGVIDLGVLVLATLLHCFKHYPFTFPMVVLALGYIGLTPMQWTLLAYD